MYGESYLDSLSMFRLELGISWAGGAYRWPSGVSWVETVILPRIIACRPVQGPVVPGCVPAVREAAAEDGAWNA